VKKMRISEQNRNLGAKTENHHFLKTDELWSRYFDIFGSPRPGLHDCRNLWAKVHKRQRYGEV